MSTEAIPEANSSLKAWRYPYLSTYPDLFGVLVPLVRANPRPEVVGSNRAELSLHQGGVFADSVAVLLLRQRHRFDLVGWS